jgi:hypothetical protein
MTRVLVHSTRWDRGYIPGNYTSEYIPTHITKFEKSFKDENHPLTPFKEAALALKIIGKKKGNAIAWDIHEDQVRLVEKY